MQNVEERHKREGEVVGGTGRLSKGKINGGDIQKGYGKRESEMEGEGGMREECDI